MQGLFALAERYKDKGYTAGTQAARPQLELTIKGFEVVEAESNYLAC